MKVAQILMFSLLVHMLSLIPLERDAALHAGSLQGISLSTGLTTLVRKLGKVTGQKKEVNCWAAAPKIFAGPMKVVKPGQPLRRYSEDILCMLNLCAPVLSSQQIEVLPGEGGQRPEGKLGSSRQHPFPIIFPRPSFLFSIFSFVL